ncbi:ABC transporter ATP-binding protein [Rubritalea tangerina]|uniref:ABC transporter ATP-binding protein n=1 Tax=Rubritalea tangerina TaxID=430798 RepID=A0ABW4ZCI4_9BACT
MPDIADTHKNGLKLQSVSVTIGNSRILSQISLDLDPGQLVALIGPSGAGKSTLMRCILGLKSPSRGSITFNAKPPSQAGPLGYVPQHDQLHQHLTVERELDYAAQLRLPNDSQDQRQQIIQDILQKVDLTERKNLKINKLSGGQRKRVSLALELLTNPELLILDEPTSGLDPNLESKMMHFFAQLTEKKRTIIVATHAMESIMLCDQVVMLMQGHLIFSGSPQKTLDHFQQNEFVDIFKALDKHPVSHWSKQWPPSP